MLFMGGIVSNMCVSATCSCYRAQLLVLWQYHKISGICLLLGSRSTPNMGRILGPDYGPKNGPTFEPQTVGHKCES